MRLSGLLVIAVAASGLSPVVSDAQVPEVVADVLEFNPDLPPELYALVSEGAETWFDEFVESGERPNDESLEWFLGASGFSSELAASGWRWFDVPYGANKTSIQVKVDETGQALVLRLDLTRIGGGRASQLLTGTMLAEAAEDGPARFHVANGILGLYLPFEFESVNDMVLRKAINALLAQAEQTAPVWSTSDLTGG